MSDPGQLEQVGSATAALDAWIPLVLVPVSTSPCTDTVLHLASQRRPVNTVLIVVDGKEVKALAGGTSTHHPGIALKLIFL